MTRPFKTGALVLCLLGGEGQREPHGEWQLHIQIATWDARLHIRREKKRDGLCLCVDTAVSRSTNTRSVCPANCEVPYGHKEHNRAEKYLCLSGFLFRKEIIYAGWILIIKTCSSYMRTEYLLINVCALKKTSILTFGRFLQKQI